MNRPRPHGQSACTDTNSARGFLGQNTQPDAGVGAVLRQSRRQRDCRGLDAENVGPETDAGNARRIARGEFLGREAPFGPDEPDHTAVVGHERVNMEGTATRIGDDDTITAGPLPQQRGDGSRLTDLEERVSSTLLAGLDHTPAEPLEGAGRRLSDTPKRVEGHEPGDAEFGQFLDQPFLPVALGQCNGERESRCVPRCIVRRLVNVERHPVAGDHRHPCGPRRAAAIEECHRIADLAPKHTGEVTGLVAFQDGTTRQRRC